MKRNSKASKSTIFMTLQERDLDKHVLLPSILSNFTAYSFAHVIMKIYKLDYVKMTYNFVQEMKDYKAEVKVAKSRF